MLEFYLFWKYTQPDINSDSPNLWKMIGTSYEQFILFLPFGKYFLLDSLKTKESDFWNYKHLVLKTSCSPTLNIFSQVALISLCVFTIGSNNYPELCRMISSQLVFNIWFLCKYNIILLVLLLHKYIYYEKHISYHIILLKFDN